jgi:hypothetical protein
VDVVGGAIKLPKQIVDPDSLAPYDLIRSMLEQEFMTEGSQMLLYYISPIREFCYES